MKTCSKCKGTYPPTPEYFHRNKATKDGLHNYCKECNIFAAQVSINRLIQLPATGEYVPRSALYTHKFWAKTRIGRAEMDAVIANGHNPSHTTEIIRDIIDVQLEANKPMPQTQRSACYPDPSTNEACTDFMMKDLARSGLLPEDVAAYPIEPQGAFAQVPAYCIPYIHNPEMYRCRYNRDENKYLGPEGQTDIWIPPLLPLTTLQESQTIWIIEGEKKAAKFYKHFKLPTIGIGGCWMFAESKHYGQHVLLPLLLSILAQNKLVNVVFDADIKTKPHVQQAASRFKSLLLALRVELRVLTIPQRTTVHVHGLTGIAPIKGMDDWLVADPSARLDDLETVSAEAMSMSLHNAYKSLGCTMDKNDRPQAIERNAAVILPELAGQALWYDEYRGLVFKDNAQSTTTTPDTIAIEFTMQLQQMVNSQFKVSVVRNALTHLEQKALKRNPVLEWFESLKWDGLSRLDHWASQFINSPTMQDDYVDEWGRLLVSGIMARTVKPGCQIDYAFILSGPQGIGKTTFFRNLGQLGDTNYYTEYTPSKNMGGDGEIRSQGAVFKRYIIVDFSEGVLLKKYSSEEVKSLITRREDTFRKMYSTSMETFLRHSICVGTTNRPELLHDPSGSRRFVILEAEAIKYMEIDYQEQLFAEAYARRAEFFSSTWHEIHAAMPGFNGDEAHATTAQQAYNLRFQQESEIQGVLLDYLNSSHPQVIYQGTPVYIRLQLQQAITNRMVQPPPVMNTALRQAISQVSFPYYVEQTRLNYAKMEFPNEHLKQQFNDHVNQGDKTVRVFIFRRKQ